MRNRRKRQRVAGGLVLAAAVLAMPTDGQTTSFVEIDNLTDRPVCLSAVGRGLRCVWGRSLEAVPIGGMTTPTGILQMSSECSFSETVVLACESHCLVPISTLTRGVITVTPDYLVVQITRDSETRLCPPEDQAN